MTKNEEAFQKEALKNMEAAADLGIRSPRMEKSVLQYGAAETAKRSFSRSRVTDTFQQLADAGHLELSLEALAVKGKHGALFTDEEEDFCLRVLMEEGYF